MLVRFFHFVLRSLLFVWDWDFSYIFFDELYVVKMFSALFICVNLCTKKFFSVFLTRINGFAIDQLGSQPDAFHDGSQRIGICNKR